MKIKYLLVKATLPKFYSHQLRLPLFTWKELIHARKYTVIHCAPFTSFFMMQSSELTAKTLVCDLYLLPSVFPPAVHTGTVPPLLV